MTLRGFGIFAGLALFALTGLAQAKIIVPAPAKKSIAHMAAKHPVAAAHRGSPAGRSRAYYDYSDAREVRETVYDLPLRHDRSRHAARRSPPKLNTRDFDGGVGYGLNGDMGYGHGRAYGGNAMMNGNGMANAAAARFSAWHGYNAHNGLGNGY
jgi:hypothetical protein